MYLLDHTCPTPAENLALDEVLLDRAEHGGDPFEMLRLWEADRPLVVVGRSSKVESEVNLPACQERGIPVFRRSSGGGAVVAGPGCLMYAVVLSYQRHPELRALDLCHRYVMGTIAQALAPLVPGVAHCGTSDLAWNDRKISGNSLRCRRDHLLYHGTLLYDFSLPLIAECLGQPPRQPEYRAGRSHTEFVANLPVSSTALRRALIAAWNADEALTDVPWQEVARLASEKYGDPEWNEQL